RRPSRNILAGHSPEARCDFESWVCFALFLGLAVAVQGQAEDYYIYQTHNGALVISNKEPPPGSKIIRQHSWAEVTDTEVPQGQKPANPPPNVQPESPPKPTKNK